MKMAKRWWGHLTIFRRAKRNRGDLVGWLARRPQLAIGTGTYEAALLSCGRADSEVKALVTIKAAMLVNCEFCLDIGSALAQAEGISEEKLAALVHYRDSALFTPVEKLCLQLVEEMSRTPALISDGLREEILTHLSKAAFLEIVAEIAWENQRARLNQGLGVRPAGFSDGAFCLMPVVDD